MFRHFLNSIFKNYVFCKTSDTYKSRENSIFLSANKQHLAYLLTYDSPSFILKQISNISWLLPYASLKDKDS